MALRVVQLQPFTSASLLMIMILQLLFMDFGYKVYKVDLLPDVCELIAFPPEVHLVLENVGACKELQCLRTSFRELKCL